VAFVGCGYPNRTSRCENPQQFPLVKSPTMGENVNRGGGKKNRAAEKWAADKG